MAAASSSGAKPPVEYEGAAAHAAPVTEAKMYPCAICETPWPHLSMMCYLRSDDKKFHVSEDGDLSKTKAAVCGKFQQRGSAEQVVFACFMCAGTAHGQTYHTEEGFPTKTFRNAADLGKCKSSNKTIQRVLDNIEKKGAGDGKPMPPLAEVLEQCASSRVAESTDWTPQIGPNLFNLYYACRSDRYPLRSNNWIRLSRIEGEGGTFQHGKWVCGSCALPWEWKPTEFTLDISG